MFTFHHANRSHALNTTPRILYDHVIRRLVIPRSLVIRPAFLHESPFHEGNERRRQYMQMASYRADDHSCE